MEDESECFMSQNKASLNYLAHEGVELKSFRLCLNWVCLDQSTLWRAGLSWSLFLVLAIGVPLISHFVLLCSNCDEKHRRPYDAVVQISLSVFAIISFLSLSSWARKYGLKRFLFLDKISHETENVQQGYAQQLERSMKLLSIFVLPCFALESAYRIWWYISGTSEIPYYGNMYISDAIACILQLCSWIYRTSLYILVCVLYKFTCYLQILKLEDYAQCFQRETDVGPILIEHLRIRRNLQIISHRFRAFILLSLVLVTASQFYSLMLTFRSRTAVNIYEAGELALCSINMVTGLFICLRSATKITHKAQAITSLAAKWHICATINSFDNLEDETPSSQINSNPVFPVNVDWGLEDEEGDGDDDIDNTKVMPIYAHTISFQKRQALVTYLENNRAGITVYGFMMDRTWIHTIFGIELALLLWLLNKTIVNWT
ncbi:DUF3537 domain-containing protein [Cephalotus follicularis]|uniref:DUF3537 domain-containing protein n=1 Tax=Cephalotus follicularis TaxID=3775 RepID=A0A1Q3AZQ4_CEPFO|nr:DUF3537 domain-containing protein [Cephalotus follicularis]